MTDYDRLIQRERRAETIPLTPDDCAIIAACEFMVSHVAGPYVAAVDAWMTDPNATAIRPLLLRQCQERNQAITLKLPAIAENLPRLQSHPNQIVAALYEPISQSFELLKKVSKIGQELEQLLAANIDAPIDSDSDLTKELVRLDTELSAIKLAFAPLMPLVDNNPAYRSYRKVAHEHRHLNDLLNPTKPA